MSSTHEDKGAYTPTPPGELLARAKRRSADARRRRRLFTGGGSLSVLVALLLVGILLPTSGAGPKHSSHGRVVVSERIGDAYELTALARPAASASSTEAVAVENAEVGFSLDLLANLAADDATGSGNVLVSPSSLATALAMLELGAKGATAQGIATALHSAGLSPAEQAAGWHGLALLLGDETSTTGTGLRQEPELNIANAVFLQEHFPVEPSFVQALSSQFQTGLWEADFAHDLAGATEAINEWTSENTGGLIKELFSPGGLTPTTVLVLADAVYFHADWLSPFESATPDRVFYLGSGSSENVPFMNSVARDSSKALTVPISSTGQYVAVQLPYAGNKLSALVVMPTAGSLPAFVSSLTPSSLAGIVSGLSPARVQLFMPTFTERSDNQLNSTLSSMGMSQAFGPGADLSGISANQQLEVHTVEQHAYLQVTPEGTTAAAATGVGVVATALRAGEPQVILVDHPFLFLVRDDATGAVLFESMVENPAS
jgi:serpin B